MYELDEVIWSCGPHTYFQDEETCVKDPNYYTVLTPCSPVTEIDGVLVSAGTYEACYDEDHENG